MIFQNDDPNLETGIARLILDKCGVICYASSECAKIFKMNACDFTGKSVFNFLFDVAFDDDAERGASFWLNDGCWRPFQGVDAKGDVFLLEVCKEKIEKKGFLHLKLKLTSKLKDEIDYLQKWQAIVEKSTDSICITDAKGVIEYVNLAFEQLTGFSYIEAVGKTPALLCAGSHSTEFFNLLWSNLSAGQEFCGIFIKRNKQGQRYHEEMLIRPFIDLFGRITHFVVTGRDVTKYNRGELNHPKTAHFSARKPLRRMNLSGQFSRKSLHR